MVLQYVQMLDAFPNRRPICESGVHPCQGLLEDLDVSIGNAQMNSTPCDLKSLQLCQLISIVYLGPYLVVSVPVATDTFTVMAFTALTQIWGYTRVTPKWRLFFIKSFGTFVGYYFHFIASFTLCYSHVISTQHLFKIYIKKFSANGIKLSS